MPLGPEDVIRKSFKTSLFKRGYDESEVDAFLEDVVVDLRRREAERDELLAQVHRPRSVSDEAVERVSREREQLDLIKTERQELVSELGGLQARLTGAREEIEQAEGRVAQAAAAEREAELRRTETQEALEVLEAQVARSEAIHHDLREASDAIVGELRGLRTEAEARALNVLGWQPDEPKGTPKDDLAVIQDLAVALHRHHVAAGERDASERRSEGERILERASTQATELLTKAQEKHDSLIAAATAEHERLIGQGMSEYERLLSEGQADHDRLCQEGSSQRGRLIAAATAENERLLAEADEQRMGMLTKAANERDQLVSEAKRESERRLREAEEQRAGILADLQARQELLEQRLSELDRTQSDYRDRLRALVSEQLAEIDREEWAR